MTHSSGAVLFEDTAPIELETVATFAREINVQGLKLAIEYEFDPPLIVPPDDNAR